MKRNTTKENVDALLTATVNAAAHKSAQISSEGQEFGGHSSI